MIQAIKNLLFPNRYHSHDEAVIISCFFNPQNSPYRIKAFNEFYKSIKHLNHQIIECVIGETEEINGQIAYRTPAQLPENENIKRVNAVCRAGGMPVRDGGRGEPAFSACRAIPAKNAKAGAYRHSFPDMQKCFA